MWVLDRAYRGAEGDTMIMLPAKQVNHAEPPSAPAVSTVVPSGILKNIMSDRHHNDEGVPENPYGHRIGYLRGSNFYMLLIKASLLY